MWTFLHERAKRQSDCDMMSYLRRPFWSCASPFR
jgi:hypothetical protein